MMLIASSKLLTPNQSFVCPSSASAASLLHSPSSICNKSGSVGAYLIFLSNGYEKGERKLANLLAWKSTKIKRVCRSSTEAETLILAQALEEGDLIRDQILTMTGLSKDLVLLECYCDAQNALEALNNNTPHNITTHYRNEFAMIKQFVDDKKVKNLVWVKGAEQMADSLTKTGAGEIDLLETICKGRFFN